MTMPNRRFYLLYLLLSMFILASCNKKEREEEQIDSLDGVRDLIEIKSTGEIRALVDNSTTSYFVYKGTPMGFEYELLERFANALKVDLKVIPVKNLDFLIDSLIASQGDIIAANLTVTKERNSLVSLLKLLEFLCNFFFKAPLNWVI